MPLSHQGRGIGEFNWHQSALSLPLALPGEVPDSPFMLGVKLWQRWCETISQPMMRAIGAKPSKGLLSAGCALFSVWFLAKASQGQPFITLGFR